MLKRRLQIMVRKYAKTTVDFLVKVVEVLITLMAAAMMCSLMWQVITRFVIKIPSIWTEEIARATFVYMAMLGASLGVRNSAHFGVTILSDRLKGKVRDIYFRYIINGIILICSVFFFVYGWEFATTYGMTRVSPTFLWPMAYVFISIPVSAVLMMIFALYNVLFEDYSHDVSLEEEIRNTETEVQM